MGKHCRNPALVVDDRTLRTYARAIGRRVRNVREEVGVSVAAIAGATGLHLSALHRLEAGERNPQLRTLILLARALGINPSELLP